MGKRYTKEEISQIKALTNEGLTDGEIAAKLDRSENGVRNIRYRMNLKADTKESLEQLGKNRAILTKDVNRLRWELLSLQSRKEELSKALQTDEIALNARLQTALGRLRDVRPELFSITVEERLVKIAAELTVSLLRYLFE